MAAEVSDESPAESELVIADIPEGQKPLICVEYPGGWVDGNVCTLVFAVYC